jgi:hypothetical protein
MEQKYKNLNAKKFVKKGKTRDWNCMGKMPTNSNGKGWNKMEGAKELPRRA